MYTLEMTTVAVSDFTEEIFYKMQTVEPEKFVEYYNTINESATESAKNVTNGVKTLLAKIMTSVFEDEENSGNNPLLIDLVVRKIFKYLSPKNLSSCRTVCKLWNEEGSRIFRQTQAITFYPESIDKMTTFTRFVTASKSLYGGESHQYPGPPFSTYCFTAQYKATQFPSEAEAMKAFVQSCGQYVRKLEIFYPDEAYLSPSDFTTFYLTGMPNLESIHIVNLPQNLTKSSFASREEIGQLAALTHLRIDRTWQMETVWGVTFLQDLLHLMPNLADYELWTWNSNTDEHSEPYLTSLSPKNVRNLRVLRPGSIGDSLAWKIATMGFSLVKLFLPVLNHGVGADAIEALLQSQKDTLVEFQLNCSTMQDSRLLTFPRMEKLGKLHLTITYPWNNDYTTFTPAIDYPSAFPGIKVLRIELAIYNDGNFINYFFPSHDGESCCTTLEELDITFSGFRDDKFIGIVSDLFPNLKTLRLDGYGSRIFSAIFHHMPNLECLQLYLIYGFNVDDQMTGIPKEVCGRLRKMKDKILMDEQGTLELEVRINPSLCSMKRLRSLSIKQKDYQAKYWPDAQCITNITGYLALSQIKDLSHLHIQSVQFTQECKQYLATALEDCWLDFA